tara:strand:+ start:2601 stop:3206 length:606 start_codon:yes stop_codon:yes gene_type:complete
MKTTTHNFEQRSKEWYDIRVGKTGGSEAIGLTTPARMETLLYKKVAEIQTGQQEDVKISQAMQEGIDKEPIARERYERDNFTQVNQVGYITNSDYIHLGLSPDGLIGDNGAIEIKCPQPKAYAKIVIKNEIPKEYKPQLAQTFLVLPELEWIDFVAFNEKFKSKPMTTIRVTREDFSSDISKHKKTYASYETKLNEMLTKF